MTTLTVVMIAGVITIVALLVIRPTNAPQPPLALPDALTLPDGATATAITLTGTRLLVVTDDDRLLIYDTGGTLLSSVTLE